MSEEIKNKSVHKFLIDKGILMDVEVISGTTGKKHYLTDLMVEFSKIKKESDE